MSLYIRDESDLVEKIVIDILEKLSKHSTSESNGLVGIDQNIAQIEYLLQMGSSEGNEWTEAMQIDVSRIKDLRWKRSTFKKMPRLRFVKFYLPFHVEPSMVQSQDAPIWSPENQDALLLSARCKELMRVASEIHIKCLHYLIIDDCSDPSLLNELTSTEISMLQSIAHDAGVEIILNSSIGKLSSLECSDVIDQQFKNLSNELLCLRCTYYLKLCRSRKQQDTRKQPKLHVLFDSLRYYQHIPVSELYNTVVVAFPRRSRVKMWLKGVKKEAENEVKGLVVATFYIHLYTVLFFLSPYSFSISLLTQTILTWLFLLFYCISLSFLFTYYSLRRLCILIHCQILIWINSAKLGLTLKSRTKSG
ncbi:hypothetical protein VNO78_34410 [Psophocarpus tetragonolobus]|uniref:Uncharacterized protein n=1 Tax=Psophocarpus tetragonolobus TaxID=3891 RepID=A0AAN9NW69_PSOTE